MPAKITETCRHRSLPQDRDNDLYAVFYITQYLKLKQRSKPIIDPL